MRLQRKNIVINSVEFNDGRIRVDHFIVCMIERVLYCTVLYCTVLYCTVCIVSLVLVLLVSHSIDCFPDTLYYYYYYYYYYCCDTNNVIQYPVRLTHVRTYQVLNRT